MRSKQAWWRTEWFWGGVTPVLPAVAFLVGTGLNLGVVPTTILVILAALPVFGLLASALLVLGSETAADVGRWLHRNDD